MILTVTPNPAVDRTVFLDRNVPGSVHRADRSQSEPSGKGVNVALALHAQGRATEAILPVGGHMGAQLESLLRASGLATSIVRIHDEVRCNISLTEPSGQVTKINEVGPTLSDEEYAQLLATVARRAPIASTIVCGGSLPPHCPVDLYVQIAGSCAGSPLVIDSSGDPLRAAITASPALIKPNVHELEDLVGTAVHTIGDVVDAAQHIRSQGVDAVLASLGADGAVLVDAQGALHATANVDRVVSTVGAGDALLAGYLWSNGSRLERLGTAMKWGTAAVQTAGTLFDPDSSTAQVQISTAEPARHLTDDEMSPT